METENTKRLVIAVEPGAREVLAALHAAGHRAYIVGGCVRDSLLGQTPHDWDITTSAKPEEVLTLFGEGRCIPTGLKHGTVTVRAGSGPQGFYEVTTFRTESGYADGRHPDSVAFIGEVRGDLARRDFTVNAMAYAEGEGLVDPFGGREDLLVRRMMRAVGNPMRRFEEDSLRILRLFRFGARLGFVLEEETLRAALALREGLRRVSMERIREEVLGMLAAPHPAAYLPEEIAAVILPEITERDGFAHAMRRVDAAQPCVRLAALLCDLDERRARAAMQRLRMDNRTLHAAAELLRLSAIAPDEGTALRTQARRLLGEIGLEQMEGLALLREAQRAAGEEKDSLAPLLEQVSAAAARGDCCRIGDLAVDGQALQRALLRKPGPWMGRLLRQLLEQVTEERLDNEPEALLAAARAILEKEKG